jgi:biotin-(acetyl-CoA carboxylase) ligase
MQLSQAGSDDLDADYDRCLLGFDQWRIFLCEGAHVEGRIEGVDNSGRLVVENRQGEKISFSHGEIEYLI